MFNMDQELVLQIKSIAQLEVNPTTPRTMNESTIKLYYFGSCIISMRILINGLI